MDRLTTGRRHVRAGSVSVTELISRQADGPESPSPGYDLPVAYESDRVTLTPITHRKPPSRGAQLAKLTSIGLATGVLCGAVAVASMINHERRETDAPAADSPARITGEQALLPDQLNRTLPVPGGAEKPIAPAAPVSADTATERPTERSSSPRPQATQATDARTSASDAQALTPASDLDLVDDFYEHLPKAPDEAFQLLSPELLHTTLGRFLESWSTVNSIDVLDLRQRTDGVLAVVRMRLADGGHLQIQQLLTVAESPRRIVGVQLLSAQRN